MEEFTSGQAQSARQVTDEKRTVQISQVQTEMKEDAGSWRDGTQGRQRRPSGRRIQRGGIDSGSEEEEQKGQQDLAGKDGNCRISSKDRAQRSTDRRIRSTAQSAGQHRYGRAMDRPGDSGWTGDSGRL